MNTLFTEYYSLYQLIPLSKYKRSGSSLSLPPFLSHCFDTVECSIVLEKLQLYGVDCCELAWFLSYLKNSLQLIVYGVWQSSILGVFMFLVHINGVWINVPSQCMQMTLLFTFYFFIFQKVIWIFPEFASIGTKNGLKSRLDMKDNKKYITISLPTSTWSHCLVSFEANLGSVYWKDSDIIRLSTIIDISRLVINLKKSKTQCMLFGTVLVWQRFKWTGFTWETCFIKMDKIETWQKYWNFRSHQQRLYSYHGNTHGPRYPFSYFIKSTV